jgi:hypothetical protein
MVVLMSADHAHEQSEHKEPAEGRKHALSESYPPGKLYARGCSQMVVEQGRLRRRCGWAPVGGLTSFASIAKVRCRGEAEAHREDWYLCPACLDVLLTVEEFATEQLSVEHVPPEALGGNELVLICKRCNNDAGRHFDAEAKSSNGFGSSSPATASSRRPSHSRSATLPPGSRWTSWARRACS